MTNHLIVCLNFVAYFVTTFYLISKHRSRISIFISLLWTVSSLFSVIFFHLLHFTYRTYNNISIYALLFLYISLYTIVYPLTDFKDENKVVINGDKNVLTFFSWGVIFISILPFLAHLEYLFFSFNSGLNTYANNYGEDVSVLPTTLQYLNRYNVYCRLFIPALFFYNLQKVRVNRILMWGLSLAYINPILGNLITGSRYVFISDTLYAVAIYLLFFKSIPQNYRRKISNYGLLFIIFCFFIFVAITIFRFNESSITSGVNSIVTGISLYAGEGFLNFSASMWDNEKFTDGYNTMFVFSYIFGDYPSPYRNSEFLTGIAGISLRIYYTFIGDFFIDYGLVVTLIIVISLSLILYFIVRKSHRKFEFCNLIWMGMIVKILVCGFTFYPYMNSSLEIIYAFILNLLLFFIMKISKTNVGVRKIIKLSQQKKGKQFDV